MQYRRVTDGRKDKQTDTAARQQIPLYAERRARKNETNDK